eukprot:XP_016660760.1 PREDICTED: uncharacterized protein LOC107884012 isoform X2 [Acyrthosiphon pisum]
MGKLEWFKYYSSISETDAKNPCNGYAKKNYPSPKKLNSPNVEKKKSSSEPASKPLKFPTPLLDSLNKKSPTDSITFNSNTIDGTKELSASNINKNVPTTSTQSSTITMDSCSKKKSDAPVSKLSKCITPSSGTAKLKPITVKTPLKDTVISESLSRGMVDDNKPASSTQITSYQKINLMPQLSMSVPPSNVFDPNNILYQKIINIENVITGMNSRVTRSLINQDKIISLIEKQNRKTLAEKLIDCKVASEFENHFTLYFPLKTLDDVIELEKLLIEKQYYKLLKTKLLSSSGADLKSVIVNIMTKLFTRNVAVKISLTATSYFKRPTLQVTNNINLKNKNIYKLIIDAVMQSLKCDEEQINASIRAWLVHIKEKYDEAEQTKNRLQ